MCKLGEKLNANDDKVPRTITMHAVPRQTDEHYGNSATIRSLDS